jgi:uncharacterized membrane protein HdeD (DUF308 family)
MLETLTRNWWVLAARGAISVVFGLLALAWPGLTVLALVLLFGAYALVDGVLELYAALFNRSRTGGRRAWLAVEGLVGVLAAIAAFVWPQITALALLYLIAAWALVTGVAEISAAIRLRQEIQGEWLLALSGLLSILFAVLAFVYPRAGALAVIWLIATYAIVFGVVLLALAFRLRRYHAQAVPRRATSATV